VTNNLAGLLALRTAAAAAVIGLTAVSPADANTEEVATWRQRVAVWVALAPGQPASYLVRGELYATDDELLPGTTVQLLIHGGIYNHDYGDLDRVDGVPYSYALEVAARGFPMFALDLLGSAHSSHLSRNQLTIQATAYIVHQIVQGLRDGSITGVEFGKVITVSPSVGSAIVWQEAISYGDVDGVIMTGVTHSRSRRFRELAKNDGYQAVDNPKLVASCLDAGYLTTVPGRRATIRVPFLAKLVGSNGAPTSGPNRQGTNLDCRSDAVVATLEAPFDSQWAWIHACVLPASGHEVSLAVNHKLQVETVVAWSSAFVGQYRFGERPDFDDLDKSANSLPPNDGLSWNCGTVSTESK